MKLKLHYAVLFFLLTLSLSGFSQQEGFLGEVKMFAGNYAPRGWAFCEGQLLAISSNTALFSVLGTMYGGDGRTTFALPDLRGRIPMGMGNGPGLTSRNFQGAKFGTETNTLTELNLPSHNHSILASTEAGTTSNPTGAVLAHTNNFDNEYTTTSNTTMNANMVGNKGSNQAVNNIQPVLTIRYIICTQGVFPVRD